MQKSNLDTIGCRYDPEFRDQLNQYRWYVNHAGYLVKQVYDAKRSKEAGKPFVRKQLMHRYVWELAGNEPVKALDHINRDKTDNRLCNLRPANSVLNSLNNAGKNVYLNRHGKWEVAIGHRNKQIYCGVWGTEEEAIRVAEENKRLLIEYEERIIAGEIPEYPTLMTNRPCDRELDAGLLAELASRGMSLDQISSETGFSPYKVKKVAKQHGIGISRKTGSGRYTRKKDKSMVADRHEENARYWANKQNDPEFMARRREKNRLAAKRKREKKRNQATDDATKNPKEQAARVIDSLEERAAIKEFEANKPRNVAEEEALEEQIQFDPDFFF